MTWYALATYRKNNRAHTGLVLDNKGQKITDLHETASQLGHVLPDHLSDLDAIIRHWEESCSRLSVLTEAAHQAISEGSLQVLNADSSSLALPFIPHRVFGAASNFVEHAEEMKTALAEKANSQPYVFMKSPDSAIGPKEAVIIPPQTEKADWEVELGVVIGKAGKNITVKNAPEHIAGYVVVNDISARDLTRRSDFPFKHDWFRGKSFDTFLPMGPWFVPRDCLGDPHKLRLGLRLNGKDMQDGNTNEMIFNSFEQIAYLSHMLMLKPGDVLATGTPAGVGMGRGLFLKPGDQMLAWVEGIGELENPVKGG